MHLRECLERLADHPGEENGAPFGVFVIINYLLSPDYVPGATKTERRQGPCPGGLPGGRDSLWG